MRLVLNRKRQWVHAVIPGILVLEIMKIMVDLPRRRPSCKACLSPGCAQPSVVPPELWAPGTTRQHVPVRSPLITHPTSGTCHLRSAKIDCLIELGGRVPPPPRIPETIPWIDNGTRGKGCFAGIENNLWSKFRCSKMLNLINQLGK